MRRRCRCRRLVGPRATHENRGGGEPAGGPGSASRTRAGPHAQASSAPRAAGRLAVNEGRAKRAHASNRQTTQKRKRRGGDEAKSKKKKSEQKDRRVSTRPPPNRQRGTGRGVAGRSPRRAIRPQTLPVTPPSLLRWKRGRGGGEGRRWRAASGSHTFNRAHRNCDAHDVAAPRASRPDPRAKSWPSYPTPQLAARFRRVAAARATTSVYQTLRRSPLSDRQAGGSTVAGRQVEVAGPARQPTEARERTGRRFVPPGSPERLRTLEWAGGIFTSPGSPERLCPF